MEFFGVEKAIFVVALAEVDLLIAAGLASKLQEVAVGFGRAHDVVAPGAEVDSEDGGDLFVVLAH